MLYKEEKLKALPSKPGVYIMKDKNEEIIYIGKAISLKNRVRQYFQSPKNKPPKVQAMISNINDFEYIIVDNEVEALILEANLIKKHKPKYNILLRDDKQYPYIKVTIGEKYPRVIKTRLISKDGSRYFGPYPSVTSVNDSIEIIKDMYMIRTCNRNLEKDQGKKRPCLNYYIKKCLGPCINDDFKEEYDETIKEIILFLEGKKEVLVGEIDRKMKVAAGNLEFEEAAKYRDQIQSILTLQEKQKTEAAGTGIDQDIIGLAMGVEESAIQVFFIRDGKIIGRENYILDNTFEEDRKKVLSSFIKQFYVGAAYIPKEIIIEEELEDLVTLEQWLRELRGGKVLLTLPKRGEKLKTLNMVKKNAIDMLDKHGDRFVQKYRENQKTLESIKDMLNLDMDINRIEAFDISNISGTNSVGSMVVFEKGDPKKSDYRRFKINTVVGPDDYKSMEEILTRRFLRGLEDRKIMEKNKLNYEGFSNFPDLIMMDGGKGQVNVAKEVLDKLDLGIPVCGLVKDDFHTTRGIIYENIEYPLKEDSKEYRMVYRIQEEAHRFAISYHRSLRSKDMFRSELDDIDGIGDKRKKALLSHFKSIEKIKNASLEDLLECPGMNRPSSISLYEHFNGKRKEEK